MNPDRLYDLMAVVVHCGSGPNRGHYISIVKSHGFWLLFDDDMVDVSPSNSIIFFLTRKLNAFSPIPENRGISDWRFLWSHFRHSKIIRNRLHSILSIERLWNVKIAAVCPKSLGMSIFRRRPKPCMSRQGIYHIFFHFFQMLLSFYFWNWKAIVIY